MSGCHRFQEELALLAGDDLAVEAWEVRAHLEGCAACRALVDGLSRDLEALRAVAAADPVDGASLVPGVLAHLSAEAHDLRTDGRDARPANRRRHASDLSFATFGRAAAVMLIVVAAGVLGLSLVPEPGLPGSDPGTLSALAQAPSAPATTAENDGRVLRVQRGAGDAVELSWNEDGRGAGTSVAVPAYKVLASSSPVDFSEARPVEVAGHALVANMPLPVQRHPDRTVTFFRVE